MFQVISTVAIAFLVIVDRFTKILASQYVAENGTKDFLFGLFRLSYVENTGAAFSSFSNNTIVLTVFTVIIIIACLVFLMLGKSHKRFIDIMLILIISGGIGNVIDRIMNGFVIDFIEPLFVNFAVFNFADCCITVGAFLLAGYEIVISFKKDGKKKERGKKDE